MRVGLIACSKGKLDHAAPAMDLYTGPIFKLARAWIEKRYPQWAILSAKYGLILPEQVIEPYDLALSDLPRLEQKRWQDWVHGQLMDRWGDTPIYTVLAGADYRAALDQMPAVEDVIGCWTRWRVDRGMTNKRAAIGIGVLKKLLKADTHYY